MDFGCALVTAAFDNKRIKTVWVEMEIMAAFNKFRSGSTEAIVVARERD